MTTTRRMACAAAMLGRDLLAHDLVVASLNPRTDLDAIVAHGLSGPLLPTQVARLAEDVIAVHDELVGVAFGKGGDGRPVTIGDAYATWTARIGGLAHARRYLATLDAADAQEDHAHA